MNDRSELNYCKLFLATGSTPVKLPEVLGEKHKNIYYVRSLDDINRIKRRIIPNQHVLVIGGGYIGLEMAAVANKSGLFVTLIEAQHRILQRVASKNISEFLKALHKKNKVCIIEGNGVQKFVAENGEIKSAMLNDGQTINCDFVVAGIGILPNTCLAKAAGLKVQDGIYVDQYCRTSDPNIFAAGDCTNFPNGINRLRLESVGNAIDQGENAAINALNCSTPYEVKPWFWSDQYSTKLQMAGISKGYEQVVSRVNNGGLSFWYYKKKRLIAVEAIDDARSYMVGKKLIETRNSPPISSISNPEIDLKALIKKP